MDDKTKRGAADRRLIDFGDRDEVETACQAMRVDELTLYIASVGAQSSSRARISEYLSGARKNVRELRKSWRAAERKRSNLKKVSK